jgi:APA family basic amino acid/polyamine antiporter
MFVSLGVYALRPREGKDLPVPSFKMPLYPVLPTIAFLGAFLVFWGLDKDAKLYALFWFIFGMILYFSYGIRHSYLAKSQRSDNRDDK